MSGQLYVSMYAFRAGAITSSLSGFVSCSDLEVCCVHLFYASDASSTLHWMQLGYLVYEQQQ